MKIFEESRNGSGSVNIVFESPVLCEGSQQKGISHLIEHMVLCTSRFDIQEEFERLGLTYQATTDTRAVVFSLKGQSKNLAKARKEFIERVTTYRPSVSDFERERQIVLQEHNDFYSELTFSTFYNYTSMKYGFVNPVGTRDAIESLTFEQVREFHERYFSRPSKVIVIDRDDLDIDLEFAYSKPVEYSGCKYLNVDAALNPNCVSVYSASPILPSAGIYHLSIIACVLAYKYNSPFVQELRQKNALCYYVNSSLHFVRDGDVMLLRARTQEKNVQRVKDLTMDMLSNPETHLTRERFELMMQINRNHLKSANDFDKYLVSDNDEVSLRNNINRITYESTLEYYSRYLHPANVAWDQIDDSSVRQMG